jgi:hypothetical protein
MATRCAIPNSLTCMHNMATLVMLPNLLMLGAACAEDACTQGNSLVEWCSR